MPARSGRSEAAATAPEPAAELPIAPREPHPVEARRRRGDLDELRRELLRDALVGIEEQHPLAAGLGIATFLLMLSMSLFVSVTTVAPKERAISAVASVLPESTTITSPPTRSRSRDTRRARSSLCADRRPRPRGEVIA